MFLIEYGKFDNSTSKLALNDSIVVLSFTEGSLVIFIYIEEISLEKNSSACIHFKAGLFLYHLFFIIIYFLKSFIFLLLVTLAYLWYPKDYPITVENSWQIRYHPSYLCYAHARWSRRLRAWFFKWMNITNFMVRGDTSLNIVWMKHLMYPWLRLLDTTYELSYSETL